MYTKKQQEDNKLYKQYEHTIDSIQNALKREIPHLIHEFNLSVQQVDTLINDFIDDKLTMFRYLRKNNYSLPTTLSLLLDTIRWRLTEQVDSIRLSSVSHDFLCHPLVYFYKQDIYKRPVLIIQLAYLPKIQQGNNIDEFLSPLVIFVLETARLLLYDLAKESNDNIVFDINILIDFKEASSLPTDLSLLRHLLTLLRRYPGITGTVNLINFGWMYQGLWQMCKLVLSNEAKSKVNFPSVKEIKKFINPKDLITDFGGTDPFIWELSRDVYFRKYRPDEEEPTGALSISSRCSSSSSIYYDSIEETTTHSLYNTPLGSLTPVSSHTNLTQMARVYSSLALNSKLGGTPRFRNTITKLGDLFITPSPSQVPVATLLTEQQPPSSPRRGWFIQLVLRMESTVRYLVIKTIKKIVAYSRGGNASLWYWVIAGVLLREGVQEFCQHIFLMMMELMLIGKPDTPNSIGMRSTLGLIRGQMTF